jgi:hypothetical protein
VRAAVATLLLFVSIVVGSYGIWLITTVDSEFRPRGSVGVACVAAGVLFLLCAVTALALRRR